jgi:acetyltransferase-like isoleucine patch superfamily enzyme
MSHGKCVRVYRRVCRPGPAEWAEFLRRRGAFYSIGEHCCVEPAAEILDPAYVRLGNNVQLANCTLIGHDGSINVLNRAYGVKLDKVGKIDIRDNCFIGHHAIIMPGITIGPNSIVAAGAVVTKDVPPNVVVAGVPAKSVGATDELVRKLTEQTAALPWADLIAQRQGAFDPAIEPELLRRRLAHFYGDAKSADKRDGTNPSS